MNIRAINLNNNQTYKNSYNNPSKQSFAGQITPNPVVLKPPVKKGLLKTSAKILGTILVASSTLLAGQKLRQSHIRELLNSDKVVKELSINNQNVPDLSLVMLKGKLKHLFSGLYFKKYSVGESKGINPRTCPDKEDFLLATTAQRIALYLKTLGNGYTGVKHSFLTSGVIKDYGEMPFGNASNALKYFKENSDKFQEVMSKTGKKLTPDELRNLPAGHIVVYSKEGLPGHISITSGYSQGISDSFDNMKWVEEYGKESSFSVFKLTDGWSFNPQTKSLEFNKK